MSQKSSSRTPPPRQLVNNESLESLTHWKTSFRTFYKRDDSFRIFFKPNFQWNPNAPNYGLSDENGEEGRSAEELCHDLMDLLNIMAGYLPNSYLTDKILKSTTNWEDVYGIIYEHYNVKITSESLLDFESMHKLSDETHHQFYERLLQHAKQHLAPKDVKVENLVNAVPDSMTISLMNMVALQWLRKCDPKLIDIIKIEYSTELRKDEQLAALVPRIAPNIDSLLSRYDKTINGEEIVNAISKVDLAIDTPMVTKISSRGRGNTSNSRGRGFSYSGNSNRSSDMIPNRRPTNNEDRNVFCPGCYYLSQQLSTPLHFRHLPAQCPRQSVTIKMLQMEDQDHFSNDDGSYPNNGKIQNGATSNCNIVFQKRTSNAETQCGLVDSQTDMPSIYNVHSQESCCAKNEFLSVSDKINIFELLEAKVRRLEERKSIWCNNGVRKSKSPCIQAMLNNTSVTAFITVDEGSEINCLDEGFANRYGLKFVPTSCKALAAGSTAMKLMGQTLFSC